MAVTRPILCSLTLAGALLLSGCSGLTASDAAIIEGRTISDSELQEATTQLNEIVPQPGGAGVLLTDLARSFLLDAVISGTPLEITDQEMRELLRENGVADPNEVTIDVARAREYLTRLQDPAFTADPANEVVLTRLAAVGQEDLEGLDVQVNPRYGTWDPTSLSLVDQAPEWITPAG